MKNLSKFIVLLVGSLTILSVTAENDSSISVESMDRAESVMQENNVTELYWYDGKKQRKIWMEPTLVAEFPVLTHTNTRAFSNDNSTVDIQQKSLVKETSGLRIWKIMEDSSTLVSRLSKNNSANNLSPVFKNLSSGGSMRALPGGVILILDSALSADQVENWLSQKELNIEQRLNFSKYAYFISTPPGMASLELANELIESDLVETPVVTSATPNWWSELSKR